MPNLFQVVVSCLVVLEISYRLSSMELSDHVLSAFVLGSNFE